MRVIALLVISILVTLSAGAVHSKSRKESKDATNIDCQVEQRGWRKSQCDKLDAGEEAARLASEEAARSAAEEEVARLASEEAARIAAEEEAARVASEEAVAHQGSVNLRWSIPISRQDGTLLSPSELAGYKIYITTKSTNESMVIAINDPAQTTYTVPDLSPDVYHMAMSSVDNGGLHSELSAVVSVTISPST